MANTDRTNNLFKLIGNGTNVVDLTQEIAQEVTIAPNVNVVTRRYSGDDFVRSVPTSTSYTLDFGDITYNAESNRLIDMQASRMLVMVGEADAREKVWFGQVKTAGLPITPQDDDEVIYGYVLTQDGLFCASGSSGCAKSFEVASGSVNAEWTVPAGSYSADTRVYVAVTAGASGGTPTLSLEVTAPTTAAVAGLSAAVGIQEVALTDAVRAALPGATTLRIRASSSPTNPISGYVVLAKPREVS